MSHMFVDNFLLQTLNKLKQCNLITVLININMWQLDYIFNKMKYLCQKIDNVKKLFYEFFIPFSSRHNGLSMLTEFGNHDIGERYVTRHELRAHVI